MVYHELNGIGHELIVPVGTKELLKWIGMGKLIVTMSSDYLWCKTHEKYILFSVSVFVLLKSFSMGNYISLRVRSIRKNCQI